MKKYRSSELDILFYEHSDIIRTSGTIEPDGTPVTGGIIGPWGKKNNPSGTSTAVFFKNLEDADESNYGV